MKHPVGEGLKQISSKIIHQNKTLEEWAEIESDDMFQEEEYVGGFDATEMEFCFSVYIDNTEYWFQLPIEQIVAIASGDLKEIEIEATDY